MAKTKFCQGLSDISDSYMGFLIDQWGVLHDGHKAYEGVIESLKELQGRKKTVIILSNSSLRADETKKVLKKMGIGPSLYTHIVTSGELAWQGLKQQEDGVFERIGSKCFMFGRKAHECFFDGLDIECVDDISLADFIMIAGADERYPTPQDYEPILREATRKRLKALCANPDSKSLIGTNYLMGPGLMARRYQDFGGVVAYIGKPHKPIFQHCIKLLQARDLYPGDSVVIGDTMAHDIMGGHLAGMDTCLIRNGIHAGAFKNAHNPAETDKALNILMAQYNNTRPTFLLRSLKWGKALPDRKHKKRKL